MTRDHNKEYTFNAAGDRSRVLETTSLGIALTQRLWIYQDYDADGKRVVRATQKQINLGPYEIVTNYYVRSSVLGGRVVTVLNSNGTTSATNVYANGSLLAHPGQTPEWVHTDPVTGSRRTTGPDGGLATRGELDPMGNDIAVTDPAPPDEPTPDYIYPGNYDQNGNHYDGASGCSLDGQPVPCSIVLRFVSVGAAGVCADNRCRPGQRLTDDGWDFWDEGPPEMVHVKGLIDLRTGRTTDWWRPADRPQRRPRRVGTQRPQRRPQTRPPQNTTADSSRNCFLKAVRNSPGGGHGFKLSADGSHVSHDGDYVRAPLGQRGAVEVLPALAGRVIKWGDQGDGTLYLDVRLRNGDVAVFKDLDTILSRSGQLRPGSILGYTQPGTASDVDNVGLHLTLVRRQYYDRWRGLTRRIALARKEGDIAEENRLRAQIKPEFFIRLDDPESPVRCP